MLSMTGGNDSSRFEQGAAEGKGFLAGLRGGEPLALASIHGGANGRQPGAAPVRAKPVGALPEDGTHANGWRAGVMRRGHGCLV